MSEFWKFPIPFIPIEDQRRVAKVMDKLDALVNDISIGLPAELSARKKQYDYYLNKLLTFPEYVSE